MAFPMQSPVVSLPLFISPAYECGLKNQRLSDKKLVMGFNPYPMSHQPSQAMHD